MKLGIHNKQGLSAMTLGEVVVVILALVVLAALLFPGNPSYRKDNKKTRARSELAALKQAIEAYEENYGHPPLTDFATNDDVTYGICSGEISNSRPVGGSRVVATNADLIIVLMNLNIGVNAGHKLNPKQISFLNARMTDDTNSPGFSGIDHEYRDPWGHSFIISLDANHDGFVRDAFYAPAARFTNSPAISLTNRDGYYEFSGKAMVWSRGVDGKIDASTPANSGVNRDNLTSW